MATACCRTPTRPSRSSANRWAYGGFQIVRSTGGGSLPGASRLSREQRHEFALGWLNWLGAESLGVLVAILNLIWVPIVAFADIAIPDKILTLPIIASFVVSLRISWCCTGCACR